MAAKVWSSDAVAPPAPAARAAPDAELDALARRVTDELAAAPAAVVAAAIRVGERWRAGIGAAGALSRDGAPTTPGTVFDLASITKPFTALAAARLARRGVVSLATPLGELVAEARGTASERVPLELFLAHRAGLASHRTLWAPLLSGVPIDRAAALRAAAEGRRDECSGPAPVEGFAPVYSDLGYLLAGEALARAAGAPLDAVIDEEVARPLGIAARSAAAVRAGRRVSVAPTEVVPFRGGVVVAAVHDENAWALGRLRVSGHAGLFGDAGDVLTLGIGLVEALAGEREAWLRPTDLAPLVRARPGGTLRAGFDGKSGEGSSAGDRFGARTFGHLGFTGTSVWIDPDASLVGVLLTNRVHPSRDNVAIRAARPLVYDAIAEWGAAQR